MPRLCLGAAEGMPCVFSAAVTGGRARTGGAYSRCLFCDAERMIGACRTPIGRGQIARLLRGLSPDVRAQGFQRVPDNFRSHFDSTSEHTYYCVGRSGEPCVFGAAATGRPAQVKGKKARCDLCDDSALHRACANERTLAQLANNIKKMAPGTRTKALQRVPALHRPALEQLLENRPRPAASTAEVRQRWADALAKRVACAAPHDSDVLKRYREKVLADKARARRQLAAVDPVSEAPKKRPRTQPGAIVNDTGLPPAKQSALAINFERWCEYHSWCMCNKCSALTPRDLNEHTLTKMPPVYISEKACAMCRGAGAQSTSSLLQYADVPEALRELSEAVRSALCPLEIDVGPIVRAQNKGGYATGYRQHSTMMRFRWKANSVRQAIKRLPRPARRQARTAFEYLLSQEEDCAYSIFVAEHTAYLEENPDADERQRRRRLQFLERVGLECALWPWLFWKTTMTFTYERASDPRRLARQSTQTLEDVLLGRPRKHQRVQPGGGVHEDSSSEEAGEAEDDTMLRHSVKRRFQRLALGPLLDYGSEFTILQFVFDLHLWSDLGSKRNLGSGVPMRVMMKGNSFSPLYWKEVHFTLLDAVRQLGYPKLFFTLAPYEWSFPYHVAIRDAMSKQLRARLDLPVLETLHITHVLLQTIRGLCVGSTCSKPPWKSELFQVVDERGKKRRVHAFTRLEFQDGHRKPASQEYHGSGRVHVHALFFVDDADVPQLRLERKLAATLPEDPALQGYVRGSQLDRQGKSGWPVFKGPSCYDPINHTLRLRHTEEDKELGLRAFLGDIMDVLKCHQDWQFADDAGVLRAYVTKYVSKFSDSASDEWLNDFADATAIFRVRGQKLVAADMVSRLNDHWYGQWLVLHVPFRRVEDLVNPEIISRVPAAHKNFAVALFSNHPVARATWSNDAAIREELKMEARTQQHADTIMQMVSSTRNLLLDYLNGTYDAAAEAAGRHAALNGATARAAPSASTVLKWNTEQRLFKTKVDGFVDVVLELQQAVSESESDALRGRLWHSNKICVCTGPPGSGKSTVAHACVERTLELDGRVLFALPKAQLASRMRERYGDRVDIDTCHAAFAFHEEVNNLPTLAHYSLVVVDEISQLDAWQYERIVQLWNAADRATVIVLVGDKWQMPGFGDRRPWHSGWWNPMTFRVTLHEAFRCKDPAFWKLLTQLRTARPDKKNLKFLASKKPWTGGGPPSPDDVRRLLKSRPDTTVLTVSRRGAQVVNNAALEGLFPRYPPKVWIDADVESNPDNYEGGERKALEALVPSKMPVYVNMQVYLTRNVRKDIDFVNGMQCRVLGWDAQAAALRVETTTGHRFAVWPWTDTDLGNIVYYPVRPGYASTVGRFQGAELPHVTLYLDAPGVPAAAYTGLSRVSTGKDFLLAANGPLTAEHCVPARG